MPLGVVSDKEFETELKNAQLKNEVPPVTTTIVTDITERGTGLGGRAEGDVNVPPALRELIGMTHATEGRQEGIELAKEFGISKQSADAYAHGSTSLATYNQPAAKLHEAVGKAKFKIASRARGVILKAMSNITDEKLSEASARELSAVSKDMAAVANSMDPSTPASGANSSNPTFIFYSPKVVEEKHFDIVTSPE